MSVASRPSFQAASVSGFADALRFLGGPANTDKLLAKASNVTVCSLLSLSSDPPRVTSHPTKLTVRARSPLVRLQPPESESYKLKA